MLQLDGPKHSSKAIVDIPIIIIKISANDWVSKIARKITPRRNMVFYIMLHRVHHKVLKTPLFPMHQPFILRKYKIVHIYKNTKFKSFVKIYMQYICISPFISLNYPSNL